MLFDFEETELLNSLLEDNNEVSKEDLVKRIRALEVNTGNLVDDINLKSISSVLANKLESLKNEKFDTIKRDIPIAEYVEY